MKIRIDRTFGFEVYFVVKKWRPIYRRFNLAFCDLRRWISMTITDGYDPATHSTRDFDE